MKIILACLFGLAIWPGICAQGQAVMPTQGFAADGSGAASNGAAQAATFQKALPPFQQVSAGMQGLPGLFEFHVDENTGTVYLALYPAQLGQVFLWSATTDHSIGERGLYGAQMDDTFAFTFRRAGGKVQLIRLNTTYDAPPGTPEARYARRSFADAVLAAAPILSAPHPKNQAIMVDATPFFLWDLPRYAQQLSQAYQPTKFQFDPERSVIAKVRSFPANSRLAVQLNFKTEELQALTQVLPDGRSVGIGMEYDLAALPKSSYKPRRADDRLGHFWVRARDFAATDPNRPYRHLITRWHLEKADPARALSPPKKPIVFWLENTIPVAYREDFKAGVLLWNSAFVRIGIKDAIEVRQMPDAADWDPADSRYNTLRVFAVADRVGAKGPSRANPFTGEIFDADISFGEEIFRLDQGLADDVLAPLGAKQGPSLPGPWSGCAQAQGLAQQAALAVALLQGRGQWTKAERAKFLHQSIVNGVAHEVGHTLGLRHNFSASNWRPLADLYDKPGEPQSASVMDYNPIIIAPPGKKQGDYLQTTLGPYDYWAIEYAYAPVADEAALARIAAKGASAGLGYATDEEAYGFPYDGAAMDPSAYLWDASSDPLAFFGDRLALMHQLWGQLGSKAVPDGQGDQKVRRVLDWSLDEYKIALLSAAKTIGGMHHVRVHAGDAHAPPPLAPIGGGEQRRALAFLVRHAFDPSEFVLPPAVLAHAAPEYFDKFSQEGFLTMTRWDYPWYEQVSQLQNKVLARLFDPFVLQRLEDAGSYGAQDAPLTMAQLFAALEDALWQGLIPEGKEAHLTVLGRNLQRRHVEQLADIYLQRNRLPEARGGMPPWLIQAMGSPPEVPGQAVSLARASLQRLQDRIAKALKQKAYSDPADAAHLQEMQTVIAGVLEATWTHPPTK